MANWRTIVIGVMVLGILWSAGLVLSAAAAEAPRKSIHELKALLGKPGVYVVDVRTERDWEMGDKKISGAAREDPNGTDSWARKYPKNKLIILYCA